MKVAVRIWLTLLLLPLVVGCGARLEGAGCGARLEDRGGEVMSAAADLSSPLPTATANVRAEGDRPAMTDLSGVVYLMNGSLRLSGRDGERSIAPLPGDAAYLALSQGRLAYVSANQLYLLDLANGTETMVYDAGDRASPDFGLHWSDDGSALGYAIAWEALDGSRRVELGTTNGLDRHTIDLLVAREAGAVPPPPPLPPIPPAPGFANLHILGYDGETGQVMVVPVGGQERYSALWTYTPEVAGRVEVLPSLPKDVDRLALAPGMSRLAVARGGRLQVWRLHTDAPPEEVPLPAGTHASWFSWSPDGERLAYFVAEGAASDLSATPVRSLRVWTGHGADGGRELRAPNTMGVVVHWTGDGQGLLLELFDPADGKPRRCLVDVKTGQGLELTLPEGSRVIGWVGKSW